MLIRDVRACGVCVCLRITLVSLASCLLHCRTGPPFEQTSLRTVHILTINHRTLPDRKPLSPYHCVLSSLAWCCHRNVQRVVDVSPSLCACACVCSSYAVRCPRAAVSCLCPQRTTGARIVNQVSLLFSHPYCLAILLCHKYTAVVFIQRNVCGPMARTPATPSTFGQHTDRPQFLNCCFCHCG